MASQLDPDVIVVLQQSSVTSDGRFNAILYKRHIHSLNSHCITTATRRLMQGTLKGTQRVQTHAVLLLP